MAISGGGWASAITGLGMMRTFDNRLPASNEQKTGGLLQCATYMSGISGGVWPVISLATQNFPSVDELLDIWIPSIDRVGNQVTTAHVESSMGIFQDLGAKFKAGFNISSSDFLGRAWGWEFFPGPDGGINVTYSSVAQVEAFVNHQMPFPILQSAQVTPDDATLEGLLVPYPNATKVGSLSIRRWMQYLPMPV